MLWLLQCQINIIIIIMNKPPTCQPRIYRQGLSYGGQREGHHLDFKILKLWEKSFGMSPHMKGQEANMTWEPEKTLWNFMKYEYNGIFKKFILMWGFLTWTANQRGAEASFLHLKNATSHWAKWYRGCIDQLLVPKITRKYQNILQIPSLLVSKLVNSLFFKNNWNWKAIKFL